MSCYAFERMLKTRREGGRRGIYGYIMEETPKKGRASPVRGKMGGLFRWPGAFILFALRAGGFDFYGPSLPGRVCFT